MPERRILLIQENIHSARFLKLLLEEADYVVDWRAAVTPALLRSGILPDAVIVDLHFLDQEDQDSLRSLGEHARWEGVPTLVTAALLNQRARRLLLDLGADEVMARPVEGQELLVRLRALWRTSGPADAGGWAQMGGSKLAGSKSGPRTLGGNALDAGVHGGSGRGGSGREGGGRGGSKGWSQRRTSLHELAEFASSPASAHNGEAILMQSLRSLRRKISFDVGFVCAETEPERYTIVAQLGERSCEMTRWYEPGMTYTGWLARHKQPLMVPNVDKETRVRMLGHEQGTNRCLQSFIGVPLMDKGHVVGTMEVASYRSGVLGADSMAALQMAADVGVVTLRDQKARRELARPRDLASDREGSAWMPCGSAAMRSLLQIASRVRESHVPVLITGETGTGKEVMARYLHGARSTRERPFVAVACAAVPETFQIREMFGIDQGVMAGVEARAGRFEECGDGTLFLDEVGHMPVSLQAKLLRVLEERRFSRIGSGKVQRFAGRVVAATSVDLKAAIESGAFLPELYHRLALIELHMPPLRTRKEDVISLARHFALQFCLEHHLPMPAIDEQKTERMLRYSWPGNVRELKNVVERTLLLSGGQDLIWDAPADAREEVDASQTEVLSLAMQHRWSVPELQLRYSRYVYEQVGRNKAQACRILRINYRTLCHHLEAADPVGMHFEVEALRVSLAS